MQRPVADDLKPATAPESLLAASVSAGLVAVVGIWAMLAFPPGPIARHMAAHIFLMNIVAPLLALALGGRTRPVAPAGLWMLTVLQLLALAAWHAGPVDHYDHATGWMWPGALLIAATGFWLAIFNCVSRWHAVAALLLTGKLVCLGGALLIFSPTILGGSAASPSDLADQQLAGLLMVTACPLSYITCALISVTRVLDTPRAAPT